MNFTNLIGQLNIMEHYPLLLEPIYVDPQKPFLA
jgi:hypothetical protein